MARLAFLMSFVFLRAPSFVATISSVETGREESCFFPADMEMMSGRPWTRTWASDPIVSVPASKTVLVQSQCYLCMLLSP